MAPRDVSSYSQLHAGARCRLCVEHSFLVALHALAQFLATRNDKPAQPPANVNVHSFPNTLAVSVRNTLYLQGIGMVWGISHQQPHINSRRDRPPPPPTNISLGKQRPSFAPSNSGSISDTDIFFAQNNKRSYRSCLHAALPRERPSSGARQFR